MVKCFGKCGGISFAFALLKTYTRSIEICRLGGEGNNNNASSSHWQVDNTCGIVNLWVVILKPRGTQHNGHVGTSTLHLVTNGHAQWFYFVHNQ